MAAGRTARFAAQLGIDPDTETYQTLDDLLVGGLKPGAEGSIVERDGAFVGEWRIAVDGDDEWLAVRADRRVLAALEKGCSGTERRRVQRKGYLFVPLERAPQAVTTLEDVAPSLALAIRLALLTDTETEEAPELWMLSGAKSVGDIADPELRARVASLVESIPFAEGLHPHPFQAVGIAFAALAGNRALIGDSPGLGKTVQALGAISLDHAHMIPAVVVAPSTVLVNWCDEIRRFAPWFTPHLVTSSRDALPRPTRRSIYVVSWHLLDRILESLLLLGLKCVVLDEAHHMKNPAARRSRAACTLAHAVPHALLLSGTPMENRITEMWYQLHALDPHEFPSLEDFKRRFSGNTYHMVRQRHQGRVRKRFFDTGQTGREALAHKLRYYMVRRLKTDVATELPEKTRSMVWVPLPPAAAKAYREVELDMPRWIQAEFRRRQLKRAARAYAEFYRAGMPLIAAAERAVAEANAAVAPDQQLAQLAMIRLGYLRRLVGEAKVGAVVQWIEDFGPGPDNPLIVFVEHQIPLKAIGEALTKMRVRWTYIDGSVGAEERGRRGQAFQRGEYDVIIGSKAMYAGLNLWRASDVLFAERWWVPAQEEQGEDRAHRIGQVHPVQVTYLMAQHTVDEHIADLVADKRALVAEVIGEERVARKTGSAVLDDGEASQSVAAAMVARVASQLTRHEVCGALSVRDLRRYLEEQRRAANG